MVAAPALEPRNLRFGAARDASYSHVGVVDGFVTRCWWSNKAAHEFEFMCEFDFG